MLVDDAVIESMTGFLLCCRSDDERLSLGLLPDNCLLGELDWEVWFFFFPSSYSNE